MSDTPAPANTTKRDGKFGAREDSGTAVTHAPFCVVSRASLARAIVTPMRTANCSAPIRWY